jgi:hypothetical protein
MRLTPGLRDQPAWIFIGTLVALAGLSYLLGIAESTNITRVLDERWLRVWGGFLFVSGGLVVGSTLATNKALERMSLRFLSLGLLVYMGWILTAVPFSRATITVTMCVSLIGLSEIRVAVLKTLLKPLPVRLMGVDEEC